METTTTEARREDARRSFVSLCVIVALLVAMTLRALWERAPLGFDESVYALRGRDISEGWEHLSGRYWFDYRAPGLPMMVNVLNRTVGEHVTVARLISLLFMCVAVVAVWIIGRRYSGEVTGVLAAFFLVAISGFVRTGSVLLADMAGAGLALAVIAVYIVELDNGLLRRAFVVVPILTFFATVARFGAPLTIGAGLAAATISYLPAILRRRDWVLLTQIAVLACAVVLACTLVLYTEMVTILGQSPASANSALISGNEFGISSGFDDLFGLVNPWSDIRTPLYSVPVAVIIFVGAALAVVGAILGHVNRPAVVFALLASATSAISLAVVVELVVLNYMALTVAFWAIAAALGWSWVVTSLWGLASTSGRYTMVGAGTLASALLMAASASAVHNTHTEVLTAYNALRTTSLQARRELGPECAIVTSFTPQVGYYSGCRVTQFVDWNVEGPLEVTLGRLDRELDQLSTEDAPIALFIAENGKRQPSVEAIDASPILLDGRRFEFGTEFRTLRHTWIVVIDPCYRDDSC